MAFLNHTGRRRVFSGHTLNTQTLTKTDEQEKKVLGKFMILRWAATIAILGCMRPMGHEFDTPGRAKSSVCPWKLSSHPQFGGMKGKE